MHPQSARFGCVSSHTLNIITGLITYYRRISIFSLSIPWLYLHVDNWKYLLQDCKGAKAASSAWYLNRPRRREESCARSQQGQAGSKPGVARSSQDCPSSSATGYEIKSSRARAVVQYQDHHTSLPTFNISHCMEGGGGRGDMQMLMELNNAPCYNNTVQSSREWAGQNRQQEESDITSTSSVSARPDNQT